MSTDNPIIKFVEDVNQNMWEVHQLNWPILDYWTNGVVEGIECGGYYLWDSEEDEFDKRIILQKIDEHINNFIKIRQMIANKAIFDEI